MENSFLHSPSEVLKHFDVSERDGLTSNAVVQAREQYGPNGQCAPPSEYAPLRCWRIPEPMLTIL